MPEDIITIVRSRWLEALRSNEYTQIYGYYTRNRQFCAIGVAYEVIRGMSISDIPWDEFPTILYDVKKYAGIDEEDRQKIVYWSDGLGLTFPEIADHLETMWRENNGT